MNITISTYYKWIKLYRYISIKNRYEKKDVLTKEKYTKFVSNEITLDIHWYF